MISTLISEQDVTAVVKITPSLLLPTTQEKVIFNFRLPKGYCTVRTVASLPRVFAWHEIWEERAVPPASWDQTGAQVCALLQTNPSRLPSSS